MGGFGGLLGKLLNDGVAQDIGPVRFSEPVRTAVDPVSGLRLPGIDENGPMQAGVAPDTDKPVLRVKPPSKFHRLMEFVTPILQGAMYGLGTAQSVHGIGAGGFGPAMGGAFQRTQQHGMQMGLMGHQLAMEEQDRALRRATLENTMRHQGTVEQGILGRLAEMQKRTEDAGAWGAPFEAGPVSEDGTRKLYQQHSKTGEIRSAMLPGAAGGVAPGAPPTLGTQATAPLAPGGAQGAMPALPSDTLLRGALGATQAPAPATGGAPTAVPSSAAPVSGQLTRGKPPKHSPGEIKYDENIPTGIYGYNDKLYEARDPKIPAEFKPNIATALAAHQQAMRDKITVAQAGKAPTPQENQAIEVAARSLASGDLTRLRDIASFRGDQRLLIYARAKELNPKFNTAQVDRQARLMELYTTGKQGDQLQSFGTFLEHAGALKDTFDGLKGTTSSKILNRPINWLRQNVNNDPEYQKVLAALDPVQKEFESYLLNNRALYTEDRATVDKIISGDLSPKQLMSSLQQMGHTVQARYNEADKRFRNGMNGKGIEETVGPLSDEAKAGADKIGVKVGAAAKQQPQIPTPPRAPNPGMKWQYSPSLKQFREVPAAGQ